MTEICLGSLSKDTRVDRHLGFCADTGCPRSVVGRRELYRILNATGMHCRKINPSGNRFRFADATYESLGRIRLPLVTPPGIPALDVEMDIVEADVPALLGMDIMDKEGLTPCTVSNRLIKRVRQSSDGNVIYVDEWSVPLVRSRGGHLYAEMNTTSTVNFTKMQLAKLHRQFFHPTAEKLYNLIKRSRPEEGTPETLKILKDLTKRCEPCQRVQSAPHRFRVTLGAEDLKFNERIFMDIMSIDGDPVLHIVDEATKFSAARFLEDVSTESVWKAIIECWAAIYTGLPNRILTDQGSQFGERFIGLATAADVEVNRTGIEAHSSLGLGERYHQPLRSTYRKIKVSKPDVDKRLALACSVKAMNDTLGPEGLVPSVLVFGEYPQISSKSEVRRERPTSLARARIAQIARDEMKHQMAKLKLRRALYHAVPPACDRTYEPGDQVLVWREKRIANRIGEWTGPYEVEAVDYEKKLAFIREVGIGPARPFNLAQVKPYLTPEYLPHSFITELVEGFRQFTSPTHEEQVVFLTETVDPHDSRADGKEMTLAKKEEVKKLIERGTFKVILKEDIPRDGNVLPGRFVLTIKSTIDGKVKFKARYVIGGHRDKLKDLMVHSSSTIQPQTVRLLLTMAGIFNFDIWTADIRQAYLQASEPLDREVFIRNPAPEFELNPDQSLKLLRPLYGLCDAGDLWHKTLDKHHRLELGMRQLRVDPALYYKMRHGTLDGLSGSYVDDLIRCGSKSFKELSAQTNERFEMSEECKLPAEFTGFVIDKDEDGVKIDQDAYLRKLECLPLSASFRQFRSMRMKLAWLSNSRPDCLFEISQLAQVTENAFDAEKLSLIKRLNKAITYAVNNRVKLRIPKLDSATLRVIGYSDSSFANNRDLTSQLGHIVFISDASQAAAPIYFKSYKSRRVTRSAMSGEVIAFSDMFDVAIALSKELTVMTKRKVPVQLLTDSKALFDVISKGSRTSEKRTMIDIAAAKEGFRDKLISDIGFVRSCENAADGLTKPMNQAQLRAIISSGVLEVKPEQWILRTS